MFMTNFLVRGQRCSTRSHFGSSHLRSRVVLRAALTDCTVLRIAFAM